MNGAGALLSILYIGLFLWVMCKPKKEETEEAYFPPFDSLRLEQEVEQLHKKMLQLREREEIIIDLRLCRPEAVQKAFRMEWVSEAGKNHVVDFFADGENATTQYLMQIAIREREELNAEIQARIYDLYLRACYEDFSEVNGYENT